MLTDYIVSAETKDSVHRRVVRAETETEAIKMVITHFLEESPHLRIHTLHCANCKVLTPAESQS